MKQNTQVNPDEAATPVSEAQYQTDVLRTEIWEVDVVAKGVKRDVFCADSEIMKTACTVKYTVAGFVPSRYTQTNFDSDANRTTSRWVKCKKSCYVTIARGYSTPSHFRVPLFEEPTPAKPAMRSFSRLGALRDWGRSWKIELELWDEAFKQLASACDLYLADSRKLVLIIRLLIAVAAEEDRIGVYCGDVFRAGAETTSYVGWPVRQ
jgi:hypothetical protein